MSIQEIKNKIHADKVESAIEDFEKNLDFEFIPVIAEKSVYDYHVIWVVSLLFCLLGLGFINLFYTEFMHDSWISRTPLYFVLPFVAYFLGYLVSRLAIVQKLFIPFRERNRQVHEKAELIFYRNRLHEIKSKNALLLYISLAERQIVILPDPKMDFPEIKNVSQSLLKILQQNFKKQDYEQGLLLSIAELKKSLLPHFLKTQNSQNNYPNKLIWWHD